MSSPKQTTPQEETPSEKEPTIPNVRVQQEDTTPVKKVPVSLEYLTLDAQLCSDQDVGTNVKGVPTLPPINVH